MADPQSSQPPPGTGGEASSDEVRIEQLLVAGLDHYFAGDFEAATNLWTRVLFLDRHHDRARAYIDRARSAQAERQRQQEALVHQGLDAFDRGDVEHARALLRDALDRGASHDLALGVLGRIERLDVTGRTAAPRPGRRAAVRVGPVVTAAGPRALSPAGFWGLNVALLLAFAGASWWLWTTSAWQGAWRVPAADARMAAIPEENAPLPVPSVSEVYMRRGRERFDSGRLREALAEFDRVPAGDPLRASADEMRAHIQRELIALALADSVAAPASAPPPAGPPPE